MQLISKKKAQIRQEFGLLKSLFRQIKFKLSCSAKIGTSWQKMSCIMGFKFCLYPKWTTRVKSVSVSFEKKRWIQDVVLYLLPNRDESLGLTFVDSNKREPISMNRLTLFIVRCHIQCNYLHVQLRTRADWETNKAFTMLPTVRHACHSIPCAIHAAHAPHALHEPHTPCPPSKQLKCFNVLRS